MPDADTKPSILIQLDPDPQPSVFDGVVAVDAGVDHLFRHGGVTPPLVRDLVHGALFTRGINDLRRTAIFVGGSDVAAAEMLVKAVKESFFGPFRVSVLFDANGSNTTAAAAVLAVLDGLGGSVEDRRCAVLAGTGPVGQRVARLLAHLGARVAIGSRSLERAERTASQLAELTGSDVDAFASPGADAMPGPLADAQVVVAAGAAGVCLLGRTTRSSLGELKVAIDLNAVPPLGIEGVDSKDKGVVREGVRCWGALGVGGTKMKIHKQALRELFKSNDQILDAEEVLELGRSMS